jgi:hypothetical protein
MADKPSDDDINAFFAALILRRIAWVLSRIKSRKKTAATSEV